MTSDQNIRSRVGDIRNELELSSYYEAFIYLSLEAISNMTRDQIASVITYGQNDAGIDAIYINQNGAHILIVDYEHDQSISKRSFSDEKLNEATNFWNNIYSICQEDVNSRLWNAIENLKSYWRQFDYGYIPHNFYFCTNNVNPRPSRRKSIEKNMNFYMTHRYHYLDENALSELLHLQNKFKGTVHEGFIRNGIEIGTIGSCYDPRMSVYYLIMSALKLEDKDPKQAKKLYHHAMKKNKEFSFLLFFISLIAPILASIMSLYTAQISEQFITIRSAIVICYIGFGVPVMLRGFLDYRNGVMSLFAPNKESPLSLVNILIGGPYFCIEAILVCLTAIFFTFFAIGPLLAIGLLFSELQWQVINNSYVVISIEAFFVVAGCISLLSVLADIWYDDLWPPKTGVRILIAGLRTNIRGVFGYFSVLVAGYVFYSLRLGGSSILPSTFHEAVIGGGLSGLFLALTLSQGDLSSEKKIFIQLGLSRCNIRLHNWGCARMPLREIFVHNTCNCLVRNDSKEVCGYLHNHLISLTEGLRTGYQQKNLENYVVWAEEAIMPALHDREIWTENIKANKRLAEDKGIRKLLDRAIRSRRWADKYLPDLGALIQLYWALGIICFLLWFLMIFRS